LTNYNTHRASLWNFRSISEIFFIKITFLIFNFSISKQYKDNKANQFKFKLFKKQDHAAKTNGNGLGFL